MLKQIVNGHILTPQGWLDNGSLIIEDNTIKAVSNSDLHIEGAEIIDAKGCHVVPGGIEMHVHGGGAAISWKAARRLSAWLLTPT